MPANLGSITADPSQPIIASTKLGFEKTWRPVRRWNLGLDQNNNANQVNQVKSAVITGTGGAGALSAAQAQNTQGVPQPVQNLRITRTVLNSSSVKVSVAFTPAASDKYFQGVSVALSQGSGTPLQIVSGKTSPVTFTIARSSASASIAVQSIGAFGDSSVGQGFGPAHAIMLR